MEDNVQIMKKHVELVMADQPSDIDMCLLASVMEHSHDCSYASVNFACSTFLTAR